MALPKRGAPNVVLDEQESRGDCSRIVRHDPRRCLHGCRDRADDPSRRIADGPAR